MVGADGLVGNDQIDFILGYEKCVEEITSAVPKIPLRFDQNRSKCRKQKQQQHLPSITIYLECIR